MPGRARRWKGVLILMVEVLVERKDVPFLMQPWQIARKSVIAGISYFAEKCIKPNHCIITVEIPKSYRKNDLENLILGFQKVSKEYKVEIVGGDTNESKEIVIDCNLICLTDADYIPRRYGAKPGDIIVVSGKFGYTSSALKIIKSKCVTTRKFKAKALSSILDPKPNFKFGFSLAALFSSSMDSSVGLSSSLYDLARQSAVVFLITILPTSKDVHDFALRNSYNF